MDAQELVERVMTEHWDIAACRCAFCKAARDLGFRPREGYPTDPRPKITDETFKDGKQVEYDWSAKR